MSRSFIGTQFLGSKRREEALGPGAEWSLLLAAAVLGLRGERLRARGLAMAAD